MDIIEAIPCADDPDRPLRLLERSLGVLITIHDLAGVFRRDGQQILSRQRQQHTHPLCTLPMPPGRQPCLDHCYSAVHRDLLAAGGPGCHHCWRGAREICVPLFINRAHVATAFAGPWRHGQAPPEVLTADQRRHWQSLPPFPSAEAEQIASLLQLILEGLLRYCRQRDDDSDSPRRLHIESWLSDHAHEQVRLSDLAQALHLSTSRCGHVINELYGQTFPALLRQRRLQRARSLLAETALPIRAIAERVGMPAEAHFHRAFKAATGHTPYRWRQACHGNRGRRWPTERAPI